MCELHDILGGDSECFSNVKETFTNYCKSMRKWLQEVAIAVSFMIIFNRFATLFQIKRKL